MPSALEEKKNCIVGIFSVFQGPSGADGIAGNKGLMVGPASNNLSVQLMMLQLSNVGSLPQATGFSRI